MGTRIGEMPCMNPRCNCSDMSVEVTAAGTWQAKCHKCGFPTFGKVGQKFRRDMEALIVLDNPAAAPGAPAPEAKAPAKASPPPAPPAKKPASSVFDLGQL